MRGESQCIKNACAVESFDRFFFGGAGGDSNLGTASASVAAASTKCCGGGVAGGFGFACSGHRSEEDGRIAGGGHGGTGKDDMTLNKNYPA